MTDIFRKALATLSYLPATVSVAVVRLYQRTLSPDHGPLRHLYPYGYCRHEPTCSEYAIQEFRKSAYPVALYRIVKRLLSCNPWTKITDEKMRAMMKKSSLPVPELQREE